MLFVFVHIIPVPILTECKIHPLFGSCQYKLDTLKKRLRFEQWALASSCVTVTYICIMYILNFVKSSKYTLKVNAFVQNGNSF